MKPCTDIDHQLYKKAEPGTEDAHGWVFKNDKEMVPYYFKFPTLKDDEVRVRVLHTGLCHSDSMTARGC